jgi:hypothetical protein
MMRRTIGVAVLLAPLIASSWPVIHGAAQDQRPSVSVVARSYEVLDVVWTDLDGSIQWNRWQEGMAEEDGWGSQATGTAKALLPASTVPPESGLAMISRRADMLDVYFINTTGSVRNTWWDRAHDGNGNEPDGAGLGRLDQRWRLATTDLTTNLTSEVQEFPASPDSGIAVVARDAGHADIFWITPDGVVVRSWWTAVDRWQPAAAITDAEAANPSSRIAAVSPLGYPGRMFVFWVDPDGRLASSQNRDEEWQTAELLTQADAVSLPAGFAVVARATDRLDVFWIAPDGAVQTLSRNAAGWQPNPTLVAPAGSADPAAGLAAIAPDPHRMEVFWVRKDGAVLTASSDDDDPGWVLGDTPLAPAGSAGSGAVAAVARTPADRDIFWVTPEGALGSAKRDRASGTWQEVVTIPAISEEDS